jgi:Short C-terminal domain
MGLLKTAGKVAVASAVHGRIQRRQQQRWAAQDLAAAQAAAPPPAPVVPAQAMAPTESMPVPPPTAPMPAPPPAPAAESAGLGDRLDQLTKLGELLKAGILTEAEFEEQKSRILNA